MAVAVAALVTALGPAWADDGSVSAEGEPRAVEGDAHAEQPRPAEERAEPEPRTEEEPRPARQTVVTATRTERFADDVVVPTEVITRRDIERSGARDLYEVLQTHPGVDFEHSFGGTGLRLQGFDPEQVMILVDGQRIAGRVRGLVDLARFTVGDVERVEIIKGPGSALYGADAMGGVVNIITRKQSRAHEGQVIASFGERMALDVRGTGGLKRESLTARLGGGRRSALPYDLNPGDPATSGSGYGGFDVNGSLTYAPTDRFELQLATDYLWRDTTAVDALATGAIFDRRGRAELFNATTRGVGYIGETRVTGSLRHSIFRDQLLQDQRAAREGDQYEASVERVWGLQVQADHAFGASHMTTVGVEQDVFLQRAARFRGLVDRYRTAVFAQDEWQLQEGGRLTLLPGVRLDLDSQFGMEPSPRVALRWAPREDLSLRAAYGWGFRAPSFQELYLSFDNPAVGYVVEGSTDLRPERSRGVTVALDHTVGDTVQFGLSAFRNDIENLIAVVTVAEPTPSSPLRFGYQNLDRARLQGLEASARFRVYSGIWLDLGYAVTDARDVVTERVLEGRSAHRLTAQLAGRVRPLKVDFSVRAAWSSPKTFYPNGVTNLDVVRTASTTELDARVGRRFFSWGSAFVGVRNALGAGDAVYLPIPPRQAYAGVMLELP